MIAFLVVLHFFFGASLGSYWYQRTYFPMATTPFSKCDICHHQLGWRDLLPVVGFVMRGGKCHYCGSRIPAGSCIWETINGTTLAVIFFGSYQNSWIEHLTDLAVCYIIAQGMLLMVLTSRRQNPFLTTG